MSSSCSRRAVSVVHVPQAGLRLRDERPHHSYDNVCRRVSGEASDDNRGDNRTWLVVVGSSGSPETSCRRRRHAHPLLEGLAQLLLHLDGHILLLGELGLLLL